MSAGTIILICLLMFFIGMEIGDYRATKRDEFFYDAAFDDHQEDIKFLTNKIVELQQKGGERDGKVY